MTIIIIMIKLKEVALQICRCLAPSCHLTSWAIALPQRDINTTITDFDGTPTIRVLCSTLRYVLDRYVHKSKLVRTNSGTQADLADQGGHGPQDGKHRMLKYSSCCNESRSKALQSFLAGASSLTPLHGEIPAGRR